MSTYQLRQGVLRAPVTLRAVPEHAEAKEPFYGGIIKLVKRILRLQGITVTVDGAENVPTTGGALLAMNHTGYYDFIFGGIPAHLRGKRLVRFMAKKEIFDVPVVGWLMRKMHHVPVDRAQGASSVAAALDHLRRGDLVGIFPEATISRSFELKDFKSGAARIAVEADVPLIPMACWGSQRVWTKGGKRSLGYVGAPVWVKVGEPVSTEGTPEEVTARLKAAMQGLLEEARADYAAEYGPFDDGAEWMPAQLGGGAPTLEEANRMDAAQRAQRAAAKQHKADQQAAKAAAKAEKKLAKKAQKQLDKLAKWTRKGK